MQLRKPFTALGAILASLAILFAAGPAYAVNQVVPATSTTTTFAPSSSTGAFTVATTTGLQNGSTIINVGIFDSGMTAYWAIPSSCTTTATTTLANCGLTAVRVNGTSASIAGIFRTLAGYDVFTIGFTTPLAIGDTVQVDFAAGAFATPAQISNGVYSLNLIFDQGTATIPMTVATPTPSPTPTPTDSTALASTGVDSAVWFSGAALLLLLGATFVRSRRVSE
ncbi:MAG: LPXTG cell wall anchor domain-containing protein [Microbacteriaceae bacterium]